MASASGLYELPTTQHLLQLTLMHMISKEILLIILLHHTWVLGWLQSVHNTFLRCFHDASKLVRLLCFSLVYSQDAKSCGYPKTCNLLTM